MQFKIGDIVVYGKFGVCRIKEVRLMSFSSDRPKEDYYILSPISNISSTYYIPVNNSSLRPAMTKKEIHSLLDKAKATPYVWPENRQIRSDSFSACLSKGVSAELVALLACIFQRRDYLSEQKKTLSSSDEQIFSSAEKLLHEEFAFSLKIPKDEVNTYISNYLKNTP